MKKKKTIHQTRPPKKKVKVSFNARGETITFWKTKQVKKTTKVKLSKKPKPRRYKKESLKKLFG